MTSPFKFLDAYDPQDKDIFFGREAEIDALYTLIYQTDLLLVYGPSGTGKTSRVQCGLASRFKQTDRFELLVRRKDNLNSSLDREIRRHAETPIEDGVTIGEAVESLYLDHQRPIHFIFDQFEELFLLGTVDEQRTFIDSIVALLKKGVACKVVLVMREEFIAMLYEFEKAVPKLFAKRFRVEPMTSANVARVITGTTAAFGIQLEHGEETAREIIENLSDHRAGVQLSYLQVYLDKLYREASKERERRGTADTPLVFTDALVRETGALEDVLADFLDEQVAGVQQALTATHPRLRADAVQIVLEEFATLEGTKQPVSREELIARLPELQSIVVDCLKALTDRRVLRQLDEVYELAHDSLARRIADSRSAERKTLLKVQKLVKDRYAGYEQTRTLLNREEIGFVTPFLTRLPLSKEETTFVARSRTKVRRRQNAAWAATAVFVSFLIVVIVIVVRARGQAEGAITAARAVVGAVARIRAKLEPIPGTEEVRRDLGESVARLSKQLGSGILRDSSTEFWRALQDGDLALRSGDVDGARRKYTESREIAEREIEEHSANAEWQRNLAISYESLGDADKETDEYTKAADSYQKALTIAERLAAADPRNVQAQHDVIVAQTALAEIETLSGRETEARARYERLRDMAAPLAQANRTDADLQRDLLTVYKSLGALQQKAKDPDGARASYTEAITIAHARTRDNPGDVVAKNDVSELYTALGDLAADTQKASEAYSYYKLSLDHDEEQAGDPQRALEISYSRLGDMAMASRNYGDARKWYGKALPIAEHLAEVFPAIDVLQRDRYFSYLHMGQVEDASGNKAVARGWFEKSRAVTEARDDGSAERDRDLETVRAAIAGLKSSGAP
jgi:tetratricopeptide (TPR) repeat protein